jgi:hypothetical protein
VASECQSSVAKVDCVTRFLVSIHPARANNGCDQKEKKNRGLTVYDGLPAGECHKAKRVRKKACKGITYMRGELGAVELRLRVLRGVSVRSFTVRRAAENGNGGF